MDTARYPTIRWRVTSKLDALVKEGKTSDAAALRGVYREIDRLEATRFAEPGVRVREWFALPTLVGLALLGAAFLLRPTAAGGAA